MNLLPTLLTYRSPAGQSETRYFTRFRPVPAKPRDRFPYRPPDHAADAAIQPPHLIVLSIPPRARFVKHFLCFNSKVFAYLLFGYLNDKQIVFAFAFAFAVTVTVAIVFAFSRCNVAHDRASAR